MNRLIESLPTSWLQVLSAYMGSVNPRWRTAVSYELLRRERDNDDDRPLPPAVHAQVQAWN